MSLSEEIAAAAARLVVEDGLEYGAAKRHAAKLVARGAVRPAQWPDNDLVEDEVRRYIELFCSDTQPAELAALRAFAAHWMQRLAELRPFLCGAVWRGTATARSAVHMELYADDPKAAEIELINQGISYQVGSTPGPDGQMRDQLMIEAPCRELAQGSGLAPVVPIVMTVLDQDDLRGRLKPDARGRSSRGDLAALRRLIAAELPAGAARV